MSDYTEVVPTKINSWDFSINNLDIYRMQFVESDWINSSFKISSENLSNLSIFLFTEPGEQTSADFINKFAIRKTGAEYDYTVIEYGRGENKIVWNIPVREHTMQDGYIYCNHNKTTTSASYAVAFIEFPPLPAPINVKVITTETS